MSTIIKSSNNQNIDLAPNGSGYANISSGYNALNRTTKNIVVGGDFSTNPWQRGTSFTSLGTTSPVYTADRWNIIANTTAKVDVTRVADAPTVAQAGVYTQHSLQLACSTSQGSYTAAEYFRFVQRMEGYNWAILAQRAFTLSFWVKSSITGTFGLAFVNSGANRTGLYEYTINNVNTWEYKTITTVGSTSAGTHTYTTSTGLFVQFFLAAGSNFVSTVSTTTWNTGNFGITSNQTNFLSSTSNTIQFALIQIEAGTIATQFDAQAVNDVLKQCQRFYFKTFPQGVTPAQNIGNNTGAITTTIQRVGVTGGGIAINLPTLLRASPTITYYSPKLAAAIWYNMTRSAASGTASAIGLSSSGFYSTNVQAAGDQIGDVVSVHVQLVAEL